MTFSNGSIVNTRQDRYNAGIFSFHMWKSWLELDTLRPYNSVFWNRRTAET